MPIQKSRKKRNKTPKYTRKQRKLKKHTTKRRGGDSSSVIVNNKIINAVKHTQSGGYKKPTGFNDKWGGPVDAFPPGPIYEPGVNNGACFYGYQTGVMAPPKNTDGLFYDNPRFIRGGKRKTKTNKKKRKKKTKRANKRKKGGNVSRFLVNNVPGFSALRDTMWKGEEWLEGTYNRYRGLPPATNSSVYNQPIANQKTRRSRKNIRVGSALLDGANKARQYSPYLKNK